jgi:hypothetical protein
MRRRRPCDENIVIVLVHGLDDTADLFDGFSATENHFRKSLPQCAMVVDVRETEVFERQSLQPMQSVVRGNPTRLVCFEQLTNLFFGHL